MSLTPLRPPTNTLPVQKKREEISTVTALYKSLKQIEASPTVLTLSQFKQFEPLFRKGSDLSELQIDALTELYRKLIDLYKPTVIVRSAADHTIVLTLPPLFTPVRSLSPTERNEQLVSINRNLSGNSVPLYSSSAFGRMARALIEEQSANKDVVENYRDMYNEAITAFTNAYTTPSPQVKTEDRPIAVTSKVFNDTTWDME